MSSFGTNGPPTVNSDNQQERILARRQRIAERADQINENPNKPVVNQTREQVPSIAHDICKYKKSMYRSVISQISAWHGFKCHETGKT